MSLLSVFSENPFHIAERGVSEAVDAYFAEPISIITWADGNFDMLLGGPSPTVLPFTVKGIFDSYDTVARKSGAGALKANRWEKIGAIAGLSCDVAQFKGKVDGSIDRTPKQNDRIELISRPHKPLFRIVNVYRDQLGRIEFDLAAADDDRNAIV